VNNINFITITIVILGGDSTSRIKTPDFRKVV